MSMARQFVDDETTRNRVLEQYRYRGFAILQNVFQTQETSAMQDEWKAIGDERRKAGKKPNAALLMAHHSYPAVAKIVRHNLLVRCIELFLSGRIQLIQSQLMFGMPG